MSWIWYRSVPSSENGVNKNELLLSTTPSFSSQIQSSTFFRWTLVVPAILILEVLHIMIISIVVKHFLSDAQSTINTQPPSTLNHALEVHRSLSTYDTQLILRDYDASNIVRTPANDELWRIHGGFVRIPSIDADAYGLPVSGTLDPLHPQESVYQLAVFHQMHCLSKIRDALVPRKEHENDITNHTLHCVEYLRQTLLCNADTTLDPTIDYLRYGVGTKKTCRDWRAVWAWWRNNEFKELDQLWELKGYKVHVEGHSQQY